MKLALQMTAAGCAALLLASCGSTGSTASNNPSGTGPFDSRGNYIEEWADNPSKWKRGGSSRPGDALVMNDQPPADSVPIPTAENTPQPGNISSMPVISRPTTVNTAVRKAPATTRRTAASTASSRPKAKTATAAKKAAPKKPATVRYTIKKGDSLSAIAARNKTSVSALQRANGIKGSLIQPGRVLVIPR
jgi:LysM repeat protein